MTESPVESPAAELIVQEHGGSLRRGNPGNRGGGRRPEEFRRKMRELASSPQAIAYLRECVHGEYGPAAAIAAWRLIAERGYGKVQAQVVVRSALEDLDYAILPDHALTRIAGGENLIVVLIELVLEGGSSPTVEHLRGIVPRLLRPGDDEAEDDAGNPVL